MNRRFFALALGAAGLAAAGARGDEPGLTSAERVLIIAAVGLSADIAAGLDVATLIARLLEVARREAAQVLRPAGIDHLWSLVPPRPDLAEEFRAARANGRLADWVTGLGPPSEAYRALRTGRGLYADFAAAGGWPILPQGEVIRPGDRSVAMAGLRARLVAEGYASSEALDASQFDDALATALREFQRTHALDDDGVLGPATRAVLNISAAERPAQIDANLERWRWLPSMLPDERVEVDTGAQEAILHRPGTTPLRMRVIVGSPKHPTPMFASQIDAVVFNPPWKVPASIARNELLPAEAPCPGLLASIGIRWVDGRLQQRPGPNNSLGLVNFDLQSRFGVYLHDTLGKCLFANPVRVFSHVCVRLEDARGLAAALLAAQGGNLAGVEAVIAAGATKIVALQRAVPLFVVHRTVRAERDGTLSFRPRALVRIRRTWFGLVETVSFFAAVAGALGRFRPSDV